MGYIGNPSQFKTEIVDFIPEIIQLVLDGWKFIDGIGPDDKEVPITKRLCATLRTFRSYREFPFMIAPEIELFDPQTGQVYAKLDLHFMSGHEEEAYFAFECKRLHIQFPSGWSKEYRKYLGDDGMGCFISGRYVGEVKHGGMIAYVMDGKVTKAVKGIDDSIQKNKKKLNLIGKNGLSKSSIEKFMKRRNIRETNHNLNPGNFKIHHIILAVK